MTCKTPLTPLQLLVSLCTLSTLSSCHLTSPKIHIVRLLHSVFPVTGMFFPQVSKCPAPSLYLACWSYVILVIAQSYGFSQGSPRGLCGSLTRIRGWEPGSGWNLLRLSSEWLWGRVGNGAALQRLWFSILSMLIPSSHPVNILNIWSKTRKAILLYLRSYPALQSLKADVIRFRRKMLQS